MLRSQLHREGDSSTNIGGQVLVSVERLLGGELTLTFASSSTTTRLRFPSSVPDTPATVPTVWFLDDSEYICMFNRVLYLSPGLDPPLEGRVFPDEGVTPEEANSTMRGFARMVIDSPSWPDAVCLDQNLTSRHADDDRNVTTGSQITSRLRADGYRGKIIILSANVSASDSASYLAAGATAVLDKGRLSREALLHMLSVTPVTPTETAVIDTPAIDRAHHFWTSIQPPLRAAILTTLLAEVRQIVDRLDGMVGDASANPRPLLHRLGGDFASCGMPLAIASVSLCKQSFTHENVSRIRVAIDAAELEVGSA
jgi:CheY-like chemotaxis protein